MNDNKELGASAADATDRATGAPHGADKSSPPSGSVSTGAGVLPGDIVQIVDPAHHWFPCLIVVSEIKAFGIQGFAFMPSNDGSGTGEAYIRLNRDAYEAVGARTIVTTQSIKDERAAALAKARGA